MYRETPAAQGILLPCSGFVCSCCSQKAVMGLTALVHIQEPSS